LKEIDESIHDLATSGEALIANAQLAAGKFPSLGPAIWLLARTAEYADLPFKVIDQRFMPPLILDQCRIFMQGQLPVAFATWAALSEEALARFLADRSSLQIHEWQSGPHKVLVDLVCPFGGEETIRRKLAEMLGNPKRQGEI